MRVAESLQCNGGCPLKERHPVANVNKALQSGEVVQRVKSLPICLESDRLFYCPFSSVGRAAAL